ncbi:MAG: hypothetical protein U5L00_04470 [Desulfovermiculus sp.]|nr:hypothetical protein [Desulfovermiculus sp.]
MAEEITKRLSTGIFGLDKINHGALAALGFGPHWAKDEKAGYKMINART